MEKTSWMEYYRPIYIYPLQETIINMRYTIPYPAVEEAKLAWNGNLILTSPVPQADTKQKSWDTPLVQATYNHLFEKAAVTRIPSILEPAGLSCSDRK